MLLASDTLIRRVTLSLEFDGDASPVHGDRVLLQQAVLNVIVNAIDAVAELRGAIVSCRCGPDRTDAITCRSASAIRARAAARHRGAGVRAVLRPRPRASAWASASRDRSSKATAARSSSTTTRPVSSSPSTCRSRSWSHDRRATPSISSTTTRRSAAGSGRLLKSAGYDVVTCDTPEAFLALPSYRQPACLLLDVRMPGMTGLELQRALHDDGRTRRSSC